MGNTWVASCIARARRHQRLRWKFSTCRCRDRREQAPASWRSPGAGIDRRALQAVYGRDFSQVLRLAALGTRPPLAAAPSVFRP